MTLATLGKVAAGVGIAVGAAAAVVGGARSTEPAIAQGPTSSEVAELRSDMKELVRKLEQFDRRLSYMEGASHARRQEPAP